MRLVLGLPTQNKAKQNSLILEPVATTLKKAVTKGMLLGPGSQEVAKSFLLPAANLPSSSPYWQGPQGAAGKAERCAESQPRHYRAAIERVDLELRDNNLITGTGDFVSSSHDSCLGYMV